MPVFFSFAQVREDLTRHTVDLEPAQIWRVTGSNSLGFQLKHIAGSVDRITSYLMEQSLIPAQMEFLRQESSGSEDIASLLALVAIFLYSVIRDLDGDAAVAFAVSASYIVSRTLHALRARNINAPFCPQQIGCLGAPVPSAGWRYRLRRHASTS